MGDFIILLIIGILTISFYENFNNIKNNKQKKLWKD